jgi:hypothetical protein
MTSGTSGSNQRPPVHFRRRKRPFELALEILDNNRYIIKLRNISRR